MSRKRIWIGALIMMMLLAVTACTGKDKTEETETEQAKTQETSSTIDLNELNSENVTKLSVWARGKEIFTENKELISKFFELIEKRELLENYESLEGDIIFNVYTGEEKLVMLYQNNVLRTSAGDYMLTDNVDKEITEVYNAICSENGVEGYVTELSTN